MSERANYLETPAAVSEYLLGNGLEDVVGMHAAVTLQPGGFANFVYKIDSEQGVYYLKQRAAFIRSRPELPRQREGIWDEVHAFEVVETVLPEGTIPHIVHIDRDAFLFIATDVLQGKGTRLSNDLARRRCWTEDGAVSATGIAAQLHGRTLGSGVTIREQAKEQAFYKQQYQWLVRDLPYPTESAKAAAIATVDRQATNPKSLIWGDLSPKNVVTDGVSAGLVDLETIHEGDPAFDLGYYIGHILLEGIKQYNLKSALNLAGRILIAYQETMVQYTSQEFTEQTMQDATVFAGAAMIYRTRNALIPEARSQHPMMTDQIMKSAADLITNGYIS